MVHCLEWLPNCHLHCVSASKISPGCFLGNSSSGRPRVWLVRHSEWTALNICIEVEGLYSCFKYCLDLGTVLIKHIHKTWSYSIILGLNNAYHVKKVITPLQTIYKVSEKYFLQYLLLIKFKFSMRVELNSTIGIFFILIFWWLNVIFFSIVYKFHII